MNHRLFSLQTMALSAWLLAVPTAAVASSALALEQAREAQVDSRPTQVAPLIRNPSARLAPSAIRELALLPPGPCRTLHVDQAAERGQRDGSAGFPFPTINAAIASATARHCAIDILLAAGTYPEDISVDADLTLKGADKQTSLIQGTLRAIGDHDTVLWDVGFVHAAQKAIFKEGGTIEIERVGVTDVKFAPSEVGVPPGAVHLLNTSGVVNGLVTEDTSSPALLVEGEASRIHSFGVVVSHSSPSIPVTEAMESVGAVEIRNGAAVMATLWKIFDNQYFGVVVSHGASLYLANAEVTNTQIGTPSGPGTVFGPDNLLVVSDGILEIDHVTSSGAGRAGALSSKAFFIAHHSRLQSNTYGLVSQSSGVYPDKTAAARCGTQDDVLLGDNSKQGLVTDGDLAVPNAPLCVPNQPCPEPPKQDLSECRQALRW